MPHFIADFIAIMYLLVEINTALDNVFKTCP